MKKIIKLLILLMWMAVIFRFSAQSGGQSQDLSDSLLARFYPLYLTIGKMSLDQFVLFFGELFRKCAHFAEYMVLGMLMYINADEYVKKPEVIAFLLTSLYAISDEVHQLFVPYRAFGVKDIIIDSLGGLFGIIILSLIIKNWKKD